MIVRKTKLRANQGQMRIIEAVIAATIVLIVFTASTMLINNSQVNATQSRSDLDKLGYNVLSRLTESGTIEATIEKATSPLTQDTLEVIQLKNFVHNSLPSTMFFSLTIYKKSATDNQWVPPQELISIKNVDVSAFSKSIEVSSTPLIYTTNSGNIYHLILLLANVGGQGN